MDECPPAFTQHFRTHKLDDMRTKIAAFVMKGIGLGNKMYEQNIPESVHNMRKAWLKFIPQEMDRFIINPYDCSIIRPGRRNGVDCDVRQVGSLPPTKSHTEMTQNEHKAFLKNVNKICPDDRVEDKAFRQ